MLLKNVQEETLSRGIRDLNLRKGETIMVLLAEKSATDVDALIRFFNERDIPFFGGLFPGLVHGLQKLNEGCILKKFHTAAAPFLITEISTGQLGGIKSLQTLELSKKLTAIVLVDGLTTNINYFLDALNNQLGIHVNFFGGGAGSLSLQQQNCLFTNEGFFQDAAICCIVEKKACLGVGHGWQKLAGPLVATETRGNTIVKLNWQNAFEVYKRTVEKDAGVEIRPDNFFEISKSYPFGMFRENVEDIVRDPISTDENGHLFCIGEIPPNTVLYILKGEPDNLIEAAGKAILDCKGRKPGLLRSEDTLIVDCISRTLFLEDRFPEELNAIRSQLHISTEEQEPQGILSLGEISSVGFGLLEYFNKTIVVGSLNSI